MVRSWIDPTSGRPPMYIISICIYIIYHIPPFSTQTLEGVLEVRGGETQHQGVFLGLLPPLAFLPIFFWLGDLYTTHKVVDLVSWSLC